MFEVYTALALWSAAPNQPYHMTANFGAWLDVACTGIRIAADDYVLFMEAERQLALPHGGSCGPSAVEVGRSSASHHVTKPATGTEFRAREYFGPCSVRKLSVHIR